MLLGMGIKRRNEFLMLIYRQKDWLISKTKNDFLWQTIYLFVWAVKYYETNCCSKTFVNIFQNFRDHCKTHWRTVLELLCKFSIGLGQSAKKEKS